MSAGRPGPDPEKVEKAAAARERGLSDREIGRELGVDGRTVARWLGPREPGSGPDGRFRPAAVDPAEAARLRAQPVERRRPWREVGAELGVSHETARRLAARAMDFAAPIDNEGEGEA